jgi:hypothetical protein
MKPEHEQFIEARIEAKKREGQEVDPKYFDQEQMPEDSDPGEEQDDD